MYFNPNAKDFLPGKARREHHHSRERCLGSPGSGEAGYRVGTHARQDRTGVSALVGTAAPSQRKTRRVPGYETESRIRTCVVP